MKTMPIKLGSRRHSLGAHVETVIRQRIREGLYAPGSLLPGRRSLCTELDIAPTTLEKAIKNLLADGTLRTETRRGTFVADTLPPIDQTPAGSDIPLPRRITNVGGCRVGIADTVTNLSMIDPIKNWFEYMIVHSAEDRISTAGNRTVYLPERSPNLRDGNVIEGAADEFFKIGVDVMVIVAYHDRKEIVDKELTRAKDLHLPAVVISTTSREWPVAHVWTDGRIAGRQAAEHLIDGGHQNITFLAPFDFEWQELRIQGVLDAMRQNGLSEEHLTIIRPNDLDYVAYEAASEVGSALMSKAIDSGGLFTAIVGANDWVSVGALQAMAKYGMTPGEDFALVSFDDSLVARQYDISSVRFPLEQLGAEAADLALRAASGETKLHRLRIGCRVIGRASSARSMASVAQ